MKIKDLQNQTAIFANASLYGWVRFVVTIAVGVFTLIFSISDKLDHRASIWTFCMQSSLFLTIIFGLIFLSTEYFELSKISNSNANKIEADNQFGMNESLYRPKISILQTVLLLTICLSFLCAMATLLLIGYFTFLNGKTLRP